MHVLNLDSLRKRGFSEDIFSAEELISAEENAWELIKLFTHREFEFFNAELKLDGEGVRELFIPSPILTITSVKVDDIELASSEYVIYNRTTPKDELEPTIVRLATPFPLGYQNVSVTGTFGLFEWNDLKALPLLEVAARMLYIMFEPLIGSETNYSDAGGAPSLGEFKQEVTDTYSYLRYDRQPSAIYSLLEDPFINSILMQYRVGDDIVFGGFV